MIPWVGFTAGNLRSILERSQRFSDIDVEVGLLTARFIHANMRQVSHTTTTRKMALLKGRKEEDYLSKPDHEIRFLVATGVRK